MKTDTSGASPGYTVIDARGVEWDVKLGPEAPVEVVVSRLVWATGFHQPPTYYVSNWTLENGPRPGPQAGGRFRPKLPEARRVDDWAWPKNPFVGTRELRGLFVLMVILNNWDLKTSQNAVYEVRRGAQRQRQYVVQDLGASLGRTRWFFPGTKGDVEDYEREPLVFSCPQRARSVPLSRGMARAVARRRHPRQRRALDLRTPEPAHRPTARRCIPRRRL